MARRIRLLVQGQVQGVGFRPFIFNLAEACGELTGFVRNSPDGVLIELQGNEQRLEHFCRRLEQHPPPLARIASMNRESLPLLAGEKGFTIAPSAVGDSHAVLISPDTSTCPQCLEDVHSPENRRFHYAFTNCTNCGPRYTITRSIPYDRAVTSMGCFPLCPECAKEYENPRDRRFHAQPNACPVCGPVLAFVETGGGGGNAFTNVFPPPPPDHRTLPPETFQGAHGKPACDRRPLYGDAAVRALARYLAHGGIAGIKGLGGFHLACHACDADAVALLRERKCRPHKPLAVMAADLEEARRLALIGPEEEALLLSPERPIVICPLLPEACAGLLAPGISPDAPSVGLMLPYTPLHDLLFTHLRACRSENDPPRPAALVMTSGNPGGEPICLGNREALASLENMANAFLLHNRDILIRVDDSVVRFLPGQGTLFLRRARGYVPRPVALPRARERREGGKAPGERAVLPPFGEERGAKSVCILGVGAELKNTLCLSKGGDAFVSQHIGDMTNVETAVFHQEMRDHLMELLQVRPTAVVRDPHPGYLCGRMAEEWAEEQGLPVLQLQHHFAHAHAVLAEHGFLGKALVLALDGTGLGDDGVLWGGEILLVDTGPEALRTHGEPVHKRLACFAPMDLPGGEAAIREPWRIAHALLARLGLTENGKESLLPLPWLPQYASIAALIPALLRGRVNSPVSTGCGRLFDAVAALLGLCLHTSYEGQAAVRLEAAQRKENVLTPEEMGPVSLYPCPAVTPEEYAARHGEASSEKKGTSSWGARVGMSPPRGLFSPDSPSRPAWILDTHALFAAVYADRIRKTPLHLIASRFHKSLAAGLLQLTSRLARENSVEHVGLSGGCLQNATLAVDLVKGLREKGITALTHKSLPPNDACISLGQTAWAKLLHDAGTWK